jgi:uncharacterized protein (UPF0332 family)
LNAEGLLSKAVTALSSEKLLLHSGDADGACNRAYYTMFDAARAFSHFSVLIIQTKAVGANDGFSLNFISACQISNASCIRSQLSGEPPTTFDTLTAISAVNPRFS